ncbi:hypothetical protein HOE04_03825 [archaeon]|nr:hypothetical protein [archaeon]
MLRKFWRFLLMEIDFSRVWAYAFSPRAMSFLYDIEWDGRVVEGGCDNILVGGLRECGEVVDVSNSKIFELDALRIFKMVYEGDVKSLIRDFYEEYLVYNPELLLDKKFECGDVFGKVCLDEMVEEIRV